MDPELFCSDLDPDPVFQLVLDPDPVLGSYVNLFDKILTIKLPLYSRLGSVLGCIL